MTHKPFSPLQRSHWRRALRPSTRRNRFARRAYLEIEALEDRTVMTSSPLAIVNSLPPAFFNDAFSFQVALSGQSQTPTANRSLVQAPFVEVDLGRGIDAEGLQAQCFGKPLPMTLVSFDSAGTPSVAMHPLTGRPLGQDPDRAGRTVAIVDCTTLDPVARSISFTGARTNGEPLGDTPVVAQGFVRVLPEGAVVAPMAVAASVAAPRELIVVNADVANADQLIRALTADGSKSYSILRLRGTTDGVQAVADYLRDTGRTFDAIHLLGHGAGDEIRLGGSTLTLANVSAFARPFATWGEHLSADADILIYGCDVAAGAAGRGLVDRIANLTGADVAASVDPTGSRARGGDWSLEYAAGRIDVAIPAAIDWDGLLGPPPVQTYFVPLPEQNIRNAFLALYSGTGSQINSTISLATTSNNTIIYYDHAEDGYEVDLANPTQSTTQVWGDGNLANGVAPGYATDVIPIGGTIVLNNLVDLPRNQSTIRFDGGDLIGATKAIAVTRAAFATNPGSVLATAVDVYDTSNYGASFQAPVGQNTPSANNMFNYASLLIQAAENGTTIQIDRDANGSIDVVANLNKGQTYQVNGGVMQGATVTSNRPVQVQLMTGTPGANYASRSFTITPTADWSNSYYSPVTTTSTSAPLAIFVYNPGTSALTVNYQTRTGAGTFSVAAKGTFRFNVPQDTAVRFFTVGGQPFYAVGTMDSDSSNSTYDWGFRLVPEANLTPAAVVGYGPGTSDLSGNGSPLWVTAVEDTTLYVDFDGNPNTGALTDVNGNQYDQAFVVSGLQVVRITDPDRNLTGARVYTVDGTLITAAWGEDPSAAAAGNPFLDMGTIIPPLPISSVEKVANVGDGNGNGAGPGDTITYDITVRNDGVVPLGNVVVTDIVPIGTTYVAGSTVVTGDSSITGPIADQVGPATAFPLDNTGGVDAGLNIGNIPVGGTAVVSFTVTINNTGLPAGGILNQAQVDASDLSSIISVVTPLGSTPGVVVFGNASGSMTQAPSYNENAPIFLTVTDPDPNLSSTIAETLTVTVVNPTTGDSEVVTLTETGVNTNVFAATLASSTSTGQSVNDGALFARAGDTLTVTYTDPYHSSDTSSDTVPIVAPSLVKQLYLSNEGGGTGQNLDRVDPTKTGTGQTDTTAAATGVISTAGIPDTISTAATTNGSNSNVASGGTLTFSHTPGTGNNRLLLVAVSVGGTTAMNSAGTVSSVTFGGTAMTLVNTITSGSIKVYLYRLVNPASAAGNVVVTVGTSASSVAAVATTFNNVDQTTPLGTSVTNFNTGNGTAGSVAVTSAVGEVVYGVAAWDEGTSNESIASAAGQTSLFNNSGFDFLSMSATTKAGAAGSVTSNWTAGDAQEYGAIGVSIRPSSTPAVSSVIFTQTTPMGGNLVMPIGGQIRVVAHVTVTSGSMPANPTITATLRRNGTAFATLASPVYDSIAGTLTWTGALGSNVTIPAGETVTLDVATTQAGVGFRIDFDDATHPSRIELPTTTVINVASVGVYDAPYVNDGNATNDGNLITTTTNGQTVYIRATVTDPFNPADITSQTLTITPPTGAPFTLTPISIIPVGTTNTKIFEYAWMTSVTSGNFAISVTANEGFEGTIASTGGAPFNVTPTDTGTPSITWFTDAAGTRVSQYAPNATVFVQTTDIDQNTNAAVAETVVVTITTSSGDTQTLTLTETGVNTGVFRASIPSSTTLGGAANDGALLAPDPTNLFVTYVDPDDPTDQSGDTAIVRASVAPNNPPVAVDDVGTTDQNTVLVVGVSGVLANDSDPDSNPLTVVTVNGSAANVGNPLTLLSGAIVTQNANGSYTYNPNGVFGYLAAGQTATDSYSYTISDGNGGFDTATVTITITGLNDPPVSTPLPPQSNIDSDAVLVPVGGSFTDPDAGDTFTFTAIGLPPGLSIDSITGLITGTLTNDASQGGVGGVYTVTITGTDSQGSPTSQIFTWTVTNLAPIATNNLGSVTEDTVLVASGNMIADNSGSGVDSDPDGDPLSIAQIQFGATTVSNPAVDVVGAYGSLNWSADGTWTYTLDNSNPAVQALNGGQSLTEVFTYTLSDGDGGTSTATLTITINGQDDPVTLAVDNVTTTEGINPFAVFTLSLSAPPTSPVSVNLALANVSAIGGGGDYGTAGAGNLQVSLDGGTSWNDATSATFAVGVQSVLVRTPIVNDPLDESTETFTLTATVTAGNVTNASASGTGTILDNDPTPSLSIDDVTVNEAAGIATFTVTLSAASGLTVTAIYANSNGTAELGLDYGGVSGSLTFLPGETTKTIDVPIVNDTIFENSEFFALNIAGPTNATIADPTGIGTILDNGTGPGGSDNDTPTLSVSSVTVTEGADAFAVFTVSLSNQSRQATTFNLALANVTANGSGVDFGTAGAGNLQVSTDGGTTWNDATAATIAALATSVLVRTPIVNDVIDEPAETFSLTATVTAGATTNPSAVGTGTILDNDPAPTISVNNVTVTEGVNPFAVFTVSLSNPSAQATTFNLALANVTATGNGTDYGTAGAGNLQVSTDGGATWNDATAATIAALTASVLVRTPIVNDSLDEAIETFTLTATVTAGTTANASAAGTGTILDNDPTPSLSINDVTVNEAAGIATFTVTLSAASGQTVTAIYANSNGAAELGLDYGGVSGSLTFLPGETTKTIDVPIVNDTIFENSEFFNLNIAGPTNATIADPTGIGTILDNGAGPGGNDNDTPTLSVSNVTVTEGTDAFAVFTVSLSNQSTQATTFTLALANVTANGGGTDYGTAGAGNLQVSTDGGSTWNDATAATIAALATSVLVRTPIVDDPLNEPTETFTLTATVTAGATTNPNAAGTGTILDDDATPSLIIDDVTVNEGAGTATFTVTLSAPSGQTVTVGYATSNGSATSLADFGAVAGTLTFAPGETTQTIVVPIFNDTIFENSEFFNVDLSAATNATITDPLGVGTILDNGTGPGGNDDDTPTLSVSSVTTTEGVDPFAIFTVSLSNQSTQSTLFDLALAIVSASGSGVDYGTAGAGNLQVSTDGGLTWNDATAATIAPLATSVLVRTPIVDDALDEATETFTLTATVTAGTTTNVSATGTGTILDDDLPPALSIDDVTVNETDGSATFTVTLSGPSGLTVTVAYATADGVATSPDDYLATSGLLTFAPGVTTQTVTVSITNDSTPEPTETFTVVLSTATNATLADDTGTGTILDNDASVDKQPPADTTYSIGDVVTYDIVVSLAEGLTQNVVVTDDLPTGLTFTGFTIVNLNGIDNGGGTLAPVGFVAPTLDGQNAVFNFGNVTTPIGPAPNTFTLRLSARVSDIPGNVNGVLLTNNANVAYVDGSLTPTNPDPTPATITVVEPQLSVVKTANDTTPHLGQTVTYTVTIRHTGASTANAYDLALADGLPAGLTLVPGSVQVVSAPGYVVFTDTSAGNQTAGTINQVNLGDVVVISYQAIVSSNPAIIGGSFGGGDDSLTNTADIDYDSRPGLDPNERIYSASGSQIVTVVGGDLAVTKSDGVAAVTPGGRLTYTITVRNDGTDAAANVVVDDTLPTQGVTFNAGLSTAGGTINGSGHLVYTLPTLAAGASQTFTVVLDVAAVAPAGLDTLVNSVTVTQTDVDPTPGDNSATDTDTVNAAPDFVVTKTDGRTTVRPGDTITYTLTLRNAGSQNATGVTLRDPLPPNVTFVSASNGGTLAGGVVTWAIGAIAGGNAQTITRTVTVRVNATLPASVTQLTNTAVAQDDGTNGDDPTPANNTATDVDTVTAVGPDLELVKLVTPDRIFVGSIVTYVFIINNLGPMAATGVFVDDPFPAGLEFVSAGSPTRGSFDVSTNRWTIGTMQSNTTERLTITARVIDDGPIVNRARAGLVEIDPNLDNNVSAALSVGMIRPASAISKQFFLSTLFGDDLQANPTAPAAPARAAAVAEDGFLALPFAAAAPTPAPVASPSTIAAASFVAGSSFATPSATAPGSTSASFGTPGIADDGDSGAITRAVSPDLLDDLFGFDSDFGRRGRAFDFELPLTRALFEEGVEIYRDPTPIDGVFTQHAPADDASPWEDATQTEEQDVGFFGQEVLDEVGIPPIMAREEADSVSLSAALIAAPMLMLALREEKEKSSRKTPMPRR